MVNIVTTPLTEERILAAAARVFREKGREGARMQEIADEAGINKAMLHYYFRSKELLFERVFLDTTQVFFSTLNEVLRAETPLQEKITALCHLYIDVSLDNPFIPLFIISEVNRQPAAFIQKMFAGSEGRPDYPVLEKQIERDVRAGRIHPVQPVQLILHILGMCIFPVIARPMMMQLSGIDEKGYQRLLLERKKIVPEMIMRSLQIKAT